MSHTFSLPTGGIIIQPNLYASIRSQADAFAVSRPWYSEFKLQLRFKKQYCYLDAEEKDDLFPLGRLCYFGPNKWCFAFYTYSNQRYEPCIFPSGEWFGTIEQAIEICEMYLV